FCADAPEAAICCRTAARLDATPAAHASSKPIADANAAFFEHFSAGLADAALIGPAQGDLLARHRRLLVFAFMAAIGAVESPAVLAMRAVGIGLAAAAGDGSGSGRRGEQATSYRGYELTAWSWGNGTREEIKAGSVHRGVPPRT